MKLTEAYRISDKNTRGLESAIGSNDDELISAYIKDIYREIFDNTQLLDGDELELYTATVDVSSDNGSAGVDNELRKLQAFLSDKNIIMCTEECNENLQKVQELVNMFIDVFGKLGEGFLQDLKKSGYTLVDNKVEQLLTEGEIDDKELLDDSREFIDASSDEMFTPDDLDTLEIVNDDDGVRESVRNDGEHDHTQVEDVIVDDLFQPDDISELNIK